MKAPALLAPLWVVPILALTISSLTVPPTAVAEPSRSPAEPVTLDLDGGDLDDRPGRPDAVSASASARVSGVPVEDISQRTEDTRVFAQPDGTWRAEAASGPEQVQDGDPRELGTHGDILTQVLLPTSGDATGIPSWFPVDEYGNQLQLWFTAFGLFPTQISDGIWDGGMAYGWLGAKEREIHASGLMLMGARVYNPYNGSFTSVDPVFGGNTTVYAYPQDPINIFDLTGEMAALAVAGLVAGVSVSQVLAVIAITVLAAIGIKAIWKGTAWAKKQITTLYNKSKHAKKRQG